MVSRKNSKKSAQKPIESYAHKDKERLNNPPVGLVTPKTDPDTGKKQTYAYDPHLEPQLHWAGKAEHSSFAVPTVSLHVHERIDPKTIIEAVSKVADDGGQRSLFAEPAPLRQAVDFYQHKAGWSRLARNLKAEIDEELIEAYRGSVSLPFSAGEYQRVAVKIVDDRGIESLRVINIVPAEVG